MFYFDADKLKTVRKQKRLTSQELADILGVHRVTIARYESGRLIPNGKRLNELSVALNVSIYDLSSVQIEKQNEYFSSILRYSHKTQEKRVDEKRKWHDTVHSFYKNIYNLTQAVQGILHSLPSMFYIKNTELEYVIANDSYCKNLNSSLDKIVGKTDFDLLTRNEARLNHFRDKEIIEKKEVIQLRDTILKTNKEKNGLIIKAPLYDKDQEIIGVLCSITDITEQIKLEHEKDTLISLLNKSDQAFFTGSFLSDTYDFISDGMEKIYGLSKEQFYKNPRIWENMIHPDYKEEVLKEENIAIKNKASFNKQYPIILSTGEEKWIEIVLHIHKDMSVLGIVKDITEKKDQEAEERRNYSKLLIKQVADHLPEQVWIYNANGYQYMNNATEKIFGIPKETFYKNTECWLDVVHPEDKNRVLSWMNNGYPTGKIEYRIINSSGEIKHINDMTSKFEILNNGKKEIIHFGLVRDITEQINRKTNDLFRKIFDHFPEQIWISKNKKVLYINDATSHIYGVSKEQFYKDPDAWIKTIHPEDVDRVTKWFNEDTKNGEIRYRVVHPNGEIRYLHDLIFAGNNIEGEVLHLGIVRDITKYME